MSNLPMKKMYAFVVEQTALRRSYEKLRESCPELAGDHMEVGWGNGYVIIPEGHPFYMTHYNSHSIPVNFPDYFTECMISRAKEIPECENGINDFVDVHWGLTYSSYCERIQFNEPVEFLEGREPEDESEKKGWVVGFDTAHFNDTLERWPKEAVVAETLRLVEQLEAYWTKEKFIEAQERILAEDDEN